MAHSSGKVAGALFFIAVTQFVLGLIVSEALYSGYSISDNYISDLGVGPSSMIFNSSAFFLGLLLIIGTYFLQRALKAFEVLKVLLVLTAIGAMGVGVFTEYNMPIHEILALMTFLCSGLSAIFSVICSYVHKFELVKMPFSVISVMLGAITLGALVLYVSKIYLGLGVGGMERMIVYPIVMWGAGFGGHLIAHPEKQKTEQKPQ